jgi:replication-associated recombination protein RarA
MAIILKTQNDYLLLEVISALQKEIRRGNERNALYWAFELIPKYEAYLWRRLQVISHEDIGCGSPLVIIFVRCASADYFDFRSRRGQDGAAKLALTNAVVLLCRSEKSRLADHLQCVVQDDRERGLRLEIPDYALDRHTGKGAKMGRAWQHWFEEGCQLNPQPSNENDKYRREAEERWQAGAGRHREPMEVRGKRTLFDEMETHGETEGSEPR